MQNDTVNRSASRSNLFTLRIWLEDLGDGKTEWRGKLQCVKCGEVRYFRDWQTLIAALQEMLPQIDTDAD